MAAPSPVPAGPWGDRVRVEPGKRGGRPIVRDLRITVAEIVAMVEEGMSEAEILEDFPFLEPDDIRACMAYADQHPGAGGAAGRS